MANDKPVVEITLNEIYKELQEVKAQVIKINYSLEDNGTEGLKTTVRKNAEAIEKVDSRFKRFILGYGVSTAIGGGLVWIAQNLFNLPFSG